MPFLVGVVGVTDSSGNRVDTPDENGDHSPLILQLGASMIGTKSTTEGGLTKVVVESAAAGSSAPGVVSVAALKALAHASLTDKQTRPTFDLNIGFRYDSSALAGVASSDILSAKPDDLSEGTAGRHIRLSDMPTVETFADLAKLIEGTHTRVHLKEYAAGTGKGGGIFVRRTGTAPNSDGGKIVKISTGVWWERQHAQVFDVQDYGAVGIATGPGAVDDYPAIIAAWNAFASNKRGTFRFPFTPLGYGIGTTWVLNGNFNSAVRITGEIGGVASGVSGSRLVWVGATDAATMVDMTGIAGVEVDHLDLVCSNKALCGWSVKGDVTVPQGSSCNRWNECVVYDIRDHATASCGWSVGEASGYQCDNLSWYRCTAYAHVGNAHTIGWIVQAGGNIKDMSWLDCRTLFCKYSLSWATPSGASSWRNGGGVTLGSAFMIGEGNFLIDSYTPESSTGKFLTSAGNVGGASGCIIVRGCPVSLTCDSDDIMIDYEAGHLILQGNFFGNLRTVGVTFPKIVVNSAAAMSVGNALGLSSTGNTYLNAPGPYIPVYNEGGALYLAPGVLGPNPGALQSFGDRGGTAGSPIKMRPVFGKMPDFPEFAAGILRSSAVGVISSQAPLTVTGSKASGAALASLLAQLVAEGIIVDGTSA